MANRIFKESQTYIGSWVMYFIILAEVPILILLTVLYANSDDKQEMAIALGVILGTMILVFILIFNLKLETRIDDNSISFRYFPFIRKWRQFPKDTIKSYKVIKYSPITDYGGWGFKGNKTTKAYSVLGDEGLLMDLGKKKKLLIGTMKSKELTDFMENWMEE
ncbi:hypothetical protein [Algoriphagus antarcticus]|uniref:PH (Pleckstrin Homology) domain-containing protein n=1 Tax=Algoriphagus antarcticus TaxID=238540 RepID=A0A3E0DYH5_9BACT|nr:hypothetical protein [Algoriphagus antarcticus]REG90513.1 hypothetical protein C8N25_10611 [Algoriphagus antarcticus]